MTYTLTKQTIMKNHITRKRSHSLGTHSSHVQLHLHVHTHVETSPIRSLLYINKAYLCSVGDNPFTLLRIHTSPTSGERTHTQHPHVTMLARLDDNPQVSDTCPELAKQNTTAQSTNDDRRGGRSAPFIRRPLNTCSHRPLQNDTIIPNNQVQRGLSNSLSVRAPAKRKHGWVICKAINQERVWNQAQGFPDRGREVFELTSFAYFSSILRGQETSVCELQAYQLPSVFAFRSVTSLSFFAQLNYNSTATVSFVSG